LAQRQAIHLGHHPIDHEQLVGLTQMREQARVAVRHRIHLVPQFLEPVYQHSTLVVVVFDYEGSHAIADPNSFDP